MGEEFVGEGGVGQDAYRFGAAELDAALVAEGQQGVGDLVDLCLVPPDRPRGRLDHAGFGAVLVGAA
ncbi:hypothetical protein, partial [Kribbella albertanoniae]